MRRCTLCTESAVSPQAKSEHYQTGLSVISFNLKYNNKRYGRTKSKSVFHPTFSIEGHLKTKKQKTTTLQRSVTLYMLTSLHLREPPFLFSSYLTKNTSFVNARIPSWQYFRRFELKKRWLSPWKPNTVRLPLRRCGTRTTKQICYNLLLNTRTMLYNFSLLRSVLRHV